MLSWCDRSITHYSGRNIDKDNMLLNLRGNCGEGLTTAVGNKAEIKSAQREQGVAFILDKWLQPLSGSTGYIS